MRTILEILEHLHAATIYASDEMRGKATTLLNDFRGQVEKAEAAEQDLAGAEPGPPGSDTTPAGTEGQASAA